MNGLLLRAVNGFSEWVTVAGSEWVTVTVTGSEWVTVKGSERVTVGAETVTQVCSLLFRAGRHADCLATGVFHGTLDRLFLCLMHWL